MRANLVSVLSRGLRLSLASCFAAGAVSIASASLAQPDAARAPASGAVRVVVPFLGSGIADSVARIVVARAQDAAKPGYRVENRPGDDGHFGAEVAAKAEPDGTTLLFAPVTLYAAAVSQFGDLHYSLESDFTPVTLIANAPHVLVAHPSMPVKTAKDIVALAKSRPGQMRWTSHGKTSLSQLEMEMFSGLASIKIHRVPYNTKGAGLPELLAGNADLAFESIGTALPPIKSGKLRAIAIASAQRSPALRELPTVAEAGIAGFEANYWYALLTPEGVPKPIVERLNGEFSRAINSSDVRERLLPYGIEARSSSPAELASIIQTEVAKWAKVVKAASGTRP